MGALSPTHLNMAMPLELLKVSCFILHLPFPHLTENFDML
uniref:Uncharacterized protein n=1 Tax=Rhizophora mucronata TaxID=61149 RepID=A0A2P2N114_RHIMU